MNKRLSELSRRDFARASLATGAIAVATRIESASADDATSPATKFDTGVAKFRPTEGEPALAERFQLKSHEFDFRMRWLPIESPRFDLAEVTFPSPVETPHVENNTVHGEFYRPKVDGQRPAVIVLHILGGDFELSRLVCTVLAQFGTASLFIKLPYYGPRRPPGVDRRMVVLDAKQTIEGFTQAVLDIRRGASFLAAQPKINANELGITGISLGGITAALAAANEPRFKNVAPVLAGGDLVRIAKESKEFARQRAKIDAAGIDPTAELEKCRCVDPLEYAGNLRGRNMLMINAEADEVIPKACTLALWEAAGKPKQVWLRGGHYTAVWSLPQALLQLGRFFERA
jgi:dienelactone hydrolase